MPLLMRCTRAVVRQAMVMLETETMALAPRAAVAQGPAHWAVWEVVEVGEEKGTEADQDMVKAAVAAVEEVAMARAAAARRPGKHEASSRQRTRNAHPAMEWAVTTYTTYRYRRHSV